jgi:hypothetical protein
MIELVLDAYPEAISKMDRKGFLPLHLALMSLRSSSETYIRTTVAIAIYPGAARVSHKKLYGLFPLHFCLELVNMNASEDFTLAMIEAYPEAASIKARYTNATALPSLGVHEWLFISHCTATVSALSGSNHGSILFE